MPLPRFDLAVVTTVIAMPNTSFRSSSEVSGKMVFSLMPMVIFPISSIAPAESRGSRGYAGARCDELVEEVVHPRTTERDLEPDRVALAHLEGGDGGLRGAGSRLLPRYLREPVRDELDLLLVALLADARETTTFIMRGPCIVLV